MVNLIASRPLPSNFFKKMSQSRPLFAFLSFQHVTITIYIDKSVDVVLGIRTQGGRMEGKDESTELRRHPSKKYLPLKKFSVSVSCVPMMDVVSPHIMSKTLTPSSAFFFSSSPTVKFEWSSSLWVFSKRQSSFLKKSFLPLSTIYSKIWSHRLHLNVLLCLIIL